MAKKNPLVETLKEAQKGLVEARKDFGKSRASDPATANRALDQALSWVGANDTQTNLPFPLRDDLLNSDLSAFSRYGGVRELLALLRGMQAWKATYSGGKATLVPATEGDIAAAQRPAERWTGGNALPSGDFESSIRLPKDWQKHEPKVEPTTGESR